MGGVEGRVQQDMYERALAIQESAFGPEHPVIRATLHNLAEHVKGYDVATALALHERGLAIAEKVFGSDSISVASSLHMMTYTYFGSGDYESARDASERALAIREKTFGPDNYDVAVSLNQLGAALMSMGDLDAARPVFERSLSIKRKIFGPDHPNLINALRNLSITLYRSGDDAGALRYQIEAERIERDHHRLAIQSLPEVKALHLTKGRLTISGVLTLANEELDPESRWLALDTLSRSRALVLDELATRHRAVGDARDPEVRRLVETLASARTRLANLVVRGPQGTSVERYGKLLDEARDEKNRAERALAEKSVEFRVAQDHQRFGLQEVADNLPPDSALVAYTRYDHYDSNWFIHRMILPAWSGGPAVTTSSYLAFILRANEKEPAVVRLGTASKIDTLIEDWQREVGRAPRGLANVRAITERSYHVAALGLRRAIWDPVAAQLGGARRVFLIPAGSIHLVNFATLPADEKHFLLETGPLLHVLSAERDLVTARDGARHNEGALVLGGPAFDERSLFAALRPKTPPNPPPARAELLESAVPGTEHDIEETVQIASAEPYRGPRSACGSFQSMRFHPLPAAKREGEQVVSLLDRTGLNAARETSSQVELVHLSGPAASEDRFKREAPGKRILHLATHGFFLGAECPSALTEASQSASRSGSAGDPSPARENPLLLSGLALAGANHRQEAGPHEDDGILTAEEVAALDLSGVEWAVLSGCETGLGRLQTGEGVLGLQRAFRIAGVRTLIMSLWQVEEEATREWMEELYASRLSGISTAEAVRHAGLKVLERRREASESTHPFFWGAFIASGDWR
jgi:CHAT domain-containing protein/tetratricopeptide (TPR) repeat protein